MVDHDVKEYGDIVLAQGGYGGQKLGFIAIFCGDRPLLVEFAEVKQIVAIITDRVAAGGAFVGRRQPNHVNADFVEVWRQGFDFTP